MNQICVVAKNKKTYFIKRLMEEVGEKVHLFDPWSDFIFPEADVYLVRTTGVYGSDLDLVWLKSLPSKKIINPLSALEKFRSKVFQYQWFEEEDIPCLPWLSLREVDSITIEKFFRMYPRLLVKPDRGQGGIGIEVLDQKLFSSWRKKKGADLDYILQPYVENAIEYRYFFIKNAEPIVLQRVGKTGAVANFRQQGEAIVQPLPQDLSPLVNKLVEKSLALYGAIDLIVQDGRPFILELNVAPGIEQLEHVCGKNVMKMILKLLESSSSDA